MTTRGRRPGTLRRAVRTDLAVALSVLTLGAAAVAAQEEIRTEIRLEPADVVGVDEVVELEITISVEGVQVPNIPDPVFKLDNFRIVGGPSQSTGLTIVNGLPSASRSLTWQLMPRKLGRARVHSVGITIEGQAIDMGEREVEVVREPPFERRQRAAQDPFDRLLSGENLLDVRSGRSRRPSPRYAAEPPQIFLHADVWPPEPYVGQQTLYTLSLYTQVDITAVNPEDFPDFKGFWARVIPQPDQKPEMVHFRGERFGRVVLIQRALFPRRAGAVEIEPIAARMMARVTESGPLGSLLPRTREIVRQSNPVTVRVRELPPPPPGFQGAVGDVSLAADLAPRELEVGAAATLTLELSGHGHLQGIQAPTIPELPGIEVFPPQQQSAEDLRGRSVVGSRVWSFVLVPQRPGEWELPPVEMPYFEPQRARYEVAASPALTLKVRGKTDASPAAGPTFELHPIRTAALPAVGVGNGLWKAAAPWLFGLPWLVAAVVLLVRHRGSFRRAVPAERRLLARLDQAAGEERPRQAAAAIEEAWRELLAERWRIPHGAPSTQWGRLLTERGADAAGAEELVRLADDLHYLRYAPKLSSIAELREDLLRRSRKLARIMS